MVVSVQESVHSEEIVVGGTAVTFDPDSGFQGAVHLAASYGLSTQSMCRNSLCSISFTLDFCLGEGVAVGVVEGDEWLVHKATLKEGFRPIIRRKLGAKAIKRVLTKTSKRGIISKF